MLICRHSNTFPNTSWGDGIWYLNTSQHGKKRAYHLSRENNDTFNDSGTEKITSITFKMRHQSFYFMELKESWCQMTM